jgi:plasmid stability protein
MRRLRRYHYDSVYLWIGGCAMSDILIRGLDAKTVRRLKARARKNGRSLQNEAKLVLEQAAGGGAAEIAAMLDGWKKRFAGRRFHGSEDLIREDRDR